MIKKYFTAAVLRANGSRWPLTETIYKKREARVRES